jgi:hypothetical protein
MDSEPLTVRWLIRRDITEALELGAMHAWDQADLLEHCKLLNGIAMVCEENHRNVGGRVTGDIVGWCAYTLHQSSVHIENIAGTDWEFGAVYELLQRLLNKLGAETGYRRDLITVMVPADQDDVLCFFRNCGFIAFATQFFIDGSEYKMRYDLPQSAELCHIDGTPCRRSTGYPCMLPEGF